MNTTQNGRAAPGHGTTRQPVRRPARIRALATGTALVPALVPALLLALAGGPVGAETFTLEPVVVVGGTTHESQQIREGVDRAFNSSRSVSSVDGSVIQNLNPVNKGDALRYNATGLINQPFSGDRFGGGTKIRTFGDWGASESIDGLPAFKSAGEEGGGYSNTVIPSIAVDRINVLKGGRAVQYGDGTDGGVVETQIKSGRAYENHQAISSDASTAREALIQAEAADHTETWDYYAAVNGFYADYDGEPENLDKQTVAGGLAKLGYNFGEDTRAEVLAIYDRSRPDIIRNGEINEITTESKIGSITVDHRLTDINSLQVGALVTASRSEWPARSRDRSIDNQIAFANHYLEMPLGEGLDYDGSLGVEYKRTQMKRDDVWDNVFNDVAIKSANAITVTDNLTLTGGVRYTWFNNDVSYDGVDQDDTLATDGVFSYQAGASYNVLDRTRVRVSAATGFNRFFEKYGNFGTDVLDTAGAGDEIVESRTLEVGVNQGWSSGYVDVALYNIVQDNVPRRNDGAIESVEVDQSGLEVDFFTAITDRVSVSAGYMRVIDLTTTRADGTEVNGNIYWDGQATSVPDNQFSLRLDYRITDEVGIWGAAYHSTGYEAVDADGDTTERDGFTRLDLGIGWAVTEDWSVRARVENLLDERDFGSTVSGVPVDDDGKLGRVFWIGTDYTF